MTKIRQFSLSLFALSIAVSLCARDWYIDGRSPIGGDGSVERPFQTISEAAELAEPGDVCRIRGGVYREKVRPRISGEADRPITFLPWSIEDDVVVTGLDFVAGEDWKRIDENRFSASVSMHLGHENQVFFGDAMAWEARWPNIGSDLLDPTLAMMGEGTTPTLVVDSQLPAYDYTGGRIWVHASKYWSNWSSDIRGHQKGQLEIEDLGPFPGPKRHVAQVGAGYFIYGVREALDADNEWYYDAGQAELTIFRESGQPPSADVSIKARMEAFDLRGRSHIQISSLAVLGATIATDADTAFLELDRLRILYPYHSLVACEETGLSQTDKGVVVLGKHIRIANCEIAYSSGSGVVLFGEDNQLLNSYVHDTDYVGTYASCVQMKGTRNVVSHCTMTRSGRSIIDYAGMYKGLIQHNEMSYAGMLTSDLGLTYGNVIEGGNSEVRYNWLHDNVGAHHGNGLYYDHGTQNIITHHNFIENVSLKALAINHYAYYHLIYNNTFVGGKRGLEALWGNKYGPDMYGCRFVNNIFTSPVDANADNITWGRNLFSYDGLVDGRTLRDGSEAVDTARPLGEINGEFVGAGPDMGAFELGKPAWATGHDFENPPEIDLRRSKPLHRNHVVNSAFEHDDHLAPWFVSRGVAKVEKSQKIKIQTTPDVARTRMGYCSMRLEPGAEISQVIEGLRPDSWYELAGWLQGSFEDVAYLGVRDLEGANEVRSMDALPGEKKWRRYSVRFKTGMGSDQAVVFVRRADEGVGPVYVDDLGLVLVDED